MVPFSKIYKEDLDIVGKKAVELGELTRLGIPIPDGFVITTSFFKRFLERTGIDVKIKDIMHVPIPQDLKTEIYRSYKKLCGIFKEPSLNIFSSSPLNNKSLMFRSVKGDANLLLKIKKIWASQIHKPVAIIVQKSISSKTGRTTTNNPPKELVHFAYKIQKHFYFPKVLDYAIEKGKIYITAVKPFTGEVKKSPSLTWQGRKMQNVLIKGIPINHGIVTGPVKILSNDSRLQIKNGEIIVIAQLNKSLFGKIKKAKAIVTDAILLNAHDQMLYRKNIKIPTITGAVNATKILQNANIITVNGISGEIYRGGLI